MSNLVIKDIKPTAVIDDVRPTMARADNIRPIMGRITGEITRVYYSGGIGQPMGLLLCLTYPYRI